VSEPPQPAQLLRPAEGSKDAYVATDVACKQCGYNLYTLALAGVCPECGTPVEHSLRGFLLKYASPEWVGRVARGGWLLVVAAVLMVLGGLGMAAWGMYTALSQGATSGTVPTLNMRAISVVSAVAFAPLTVLMIVGLLLFTARNPADTVPGTDSAVRRWLRCGAWADAGLTLLGWMVAFAPDSGLPLGTRSGLMALNAPLGMAVFTAIAALGLRYIGQLMARVPRPGLVRFSGVCFWGMLICGVLMTAGQIAIAGTNAQNIAALSAASTAPGSATMPSGAAGPVLPAAGLGMMLAGCPSCVGAGFYVASFVLLIMASAALSGAAREVRQTLAPPAPGSSPLGSPT
jgi:hypothetical protein